MNFNEIETPVNFEKVRGKGKKLKAKTFERYYPLRCSGLSGVGGSGRGSA